MRYPGVELSPASEYKVNMFWNVIIFLWVVINGPKCTKTLTVPILNRLKALIISEWHEGSYFEWNTTDIGLQSPQPR